MSEAMVELSDVRVKRGDFELKIPQWRVLPGRVVGVVGPNGSGKTTLLELVAGLTDRRTGHMAGSVSVFGLNPAEEASAVRSQLGYMSDSMPVFERPISDLLNLVSGYYPTWDVDLVKTLVSRFDLDLSASPSGLSKGQGTRLRLVLALAFAPRVLVLDEPATGLDVSGRRALLREVLDVASDPNRAVIVSSHQLVDVERIVDDLLVLRKGEVLAQGEAAELIGEDRTLEEAMVKWGAA